MSTALRLTVLFALTLLSLLAALSLGASGLGLFDAIRLATARLAGTLSETDALAWSILVDIRAPRAVVAAMAGAALAAAGALSQGLFRNPLASPSVLGIEAGATLAAAFAFYTGAASGHWAAVPLAAFSGAVLVAAIVLHIAARGQRDGSPLPLAYLLLFGFALNALIGAGSSFMLSLVLEDQTKAAAMLHWLLGGFSAKGWEHVTAAILPIGIGLVLAGTLASRLDVLALGEEVARSLSVDVRRLTVCAIIAVAALVGAAVAAGGALPFVGLIVPHMMRLWLGPRHRWLLPASVLGGAALVLWADLAARTLRAPRELEVGLLTSLVGAPVFLALLFRDARRPGA